MRPMLLMAAAALLAGCSNGGESTTHATSPDERVSVDVAPETALPLESSIDVAVRGEGPADVLLIPGLASPASVWEGTATRLEDTYRLHLVGVRGFGGSNPSASTEDIADRMVQDVVAYLDGNNLDDVTVVGHSLGGFTGLRTALASDRVGRVVVVDALPFYPLVFSPNATPEATAPQAAVMAMQMRSMPPDAYADMARRNAAIMSKLPDAVARIGDWAAASDPDTVAEAMEALMTTDLRPRLPEIDVPVHVLVAHDPAMGVEREAYLKRWRDAYADTPTLTLVPVDDSFHFIMFDQPEAFASALDAALEETE